MTHMVPGCKLIGSLVLVAGLITFGWEKSSWADQLYDVTINGSVEFNQIGGDPLGSVAPGELVTLSFQLDSGDFANSPNFPTRGYEIDTSSFVLSFSGGTSIGLEDPFPMNETPYFVIRNDDPGVDGFFVSTDLDFPVGVPLNQQGLLGTFLNNFSVTYDETTLPSLDISDAEGFYDFDGLQVFNWTIDDGPFNAAGLVFSDLTITRVPEPTVLIPVMGLGTTLVLRRKRRT